MSIISIAQLVVSVLLITLILLQERSSGLSGILGGGGGEGFYQTRRGLEKLIFAGTIVLAIAFGALAIADLLL